MKTYTNDHIDDRLTTVINDLQKKVKEQRTDQGGYLGYMTIPVLHTDPAVTKPGLFGLYYNLTTGKVRKSYNGSAWADTPI